MGIDGEAPERDAGIQIILKIAVGPHGIPVDQALELDTQAKALGVDSGYLLGLFIRLGLKQERERLAVSLWRRPASSRYTGPLSPEGGLSLSLKTLRASKCPSIRERTLSKSPEGTTVE